MPHSVVPWLVGERATSLPTVAEPGLFGERLADPRFRFEALLALRTHALWPEDG
ncbi:hypothetical protein [Streptomyces sp. NPDC056144]|uniref:hypothetical protein n=1 Tax=unclassified Streptomyces TaxID=2593676 RepID=UPI0035E0D220